MSVRNYLCIAVILLAGTATLARAQSQSQVYPYYQPPFYYAQPYYYGTWNVPRSWSYDPYTSGLGPCPQRRPSDPPCKDTIAPSFGQPSYWPR